MKGFRQCPALSLNLGYGEVRLFRTKNRTEGDEGRRLRVATHVGMTRSSCFYKCERRGSIMRDLLFLRRGHGRVS